MPFLLQALPDVFDDKIETGDRGQGDDGGKAVLRRAGGADTTAELLQLDPLKYQASINGKLLSLTVVEFHLLALLAENPGRVFSRDQLIEQIYPDRRIVSDRTIGSHIKKLRKKIGKIHDRELIHSVYSVGYKFEES